ncbi:MAG: PQQ-dependent sugar dehydrogenase [Candidatus Limnocylindrales bacterium]
MHDRWRLSRTRIGAIIVAATLASSVAVPGALAGTFSVSLGLVAGGFPSLTQITNAGDGTDRLFVVEKRGTIRVIQNGAVLPGYFMDIRSLVANIGERGLLGLAFHPDFETNRRLFVYYTRNGGDIIVARYTTNAARTDVDEGSGRYLMRIEHSAQTNHNGGALAFGPSGYLFIAVGDGGGSGDPGNDAQEKSTTLLGKILRINVNGTGAGRYNRYSIPSTNPFKGAIPGRGEIWAYGLRNPWRISFDRGTGKLFIADVGENRYEEVDREPAGFTGGRNYGWSIMEGKHCFRPSKCPMAGDRLPILEYAHSNGNCSITGGYVYRGSAYPNLAGQYVFADWCSGRIWTVPHAGTTKTQRANTSVNITSFGESESGELYAVTSSGAVYRVQAP